MTAAPGPPSRKNNTDNLLKEQLMDKDGNTASSDPDAPSGRNRNGKRSRMLALVLGLFVLAGIGYGAYWGLVARYQEFTDDAYVSGNVIQITAQQPGTVVAIGADDTDLVKAGQTLVRLDPAAARIALAAADASLAMTVRRVRNIFATGAQLQAEVKVREAELARAQDDLARRERLASSGAIAGEEIPHARDAERRARAALTAAREQAAANQALVDRTTIANHPEVRDAAAKVRDAYLALARTRLPAPVSGMVTKRSVQLGQRVSPGAPLMAVVPLDQLWVDANFKEAQLRHVRVGQRVTLSSDLYGSGVAYDGKVVGLDAGTGSAFSLLPVQNATGNWIKLVQRVPVRIALDPRELAEHPLRIGLSMAVTVHVGKEQGAVLAEVPHAAPSYATSVFDENRGKADAAVARIIRINAGSASRHHRSQG